MSHGQWRAPSATRTCPAQKCDPPLDSPVPITIAFFRTGSHWKVMPNVQLAKERGSVTFYRSRKDMAWLSSTTSSRVWLGESVSVSTGAMKRGCMTWRNASAYTVERRLVLNLLEGLSQVLPFLYQSFTPGCQALCDRRVPSNLCLKYQNREFILNLHVEHHEGVWVTSVHCSWSDSI